MNRKFLFIVMVFIILLLPICLFNPKMEISTLENRTLASFPKENFIDGTWNSKEGLSDLEDYIEDHLGGRTFVTQLKNTLDYVLWNQSIDSSISYGKEGHAYYLSQNSLDSYQHRNLFSESELKCYTEMLQLFQLKLESRNIDLYFWLLPNKEAIYPEYIDDSIYVVGEVDRFTQFSSYMADVSDLNIISPTNHFLEYKEHNPEDLLYYKFYDPNHWTYSGAYLAYLELMEELQISYPDLEILKEEDLYFEIESYEQKIGLLPTMVEESLNITVKNPDDIEYTQEIPTDLQYIEEKQYFWQYTNLSNPDAPRISIVGDSYIYHFLLPILTQSFSQLTFLHMDNMEYMTPFVEAFDTDILLIETVDRMLKNNQFNDMRLVQPTNPVEIENLGNSIPINAIGNIDTIETVTFGGKTFLTITGWCSLHEISGEIQTIIVKTTSPDGAVEYYDTDLQYREDLAFVANSVYETSGFCVDLPQDVATNLNTEGTYGEILIQYEGNTYSTPFEFTCSNN